jgi:hypothetical protein
MMAADGDDHVASRCRHAPVVRDDTGHRSARGTGEYRTSRLARDMDRRRAIGIAEAFGIQKPNAGVRTFAEDHQGAMHGRAPNPLVFPGINRSGCQLGDEDPLVMSPRPSAPVMPFGSVPGASKAGTPSMRSPSSSR